MRSLASFVSGALTVAGRGGDVLPCAMTRMVASGVRTRAGGVVRWLRALMRWRLAVSDGSPVDATARGECLQGERVRGEVSYDWGLCVR